MTERQSRILYLGLALGAGALGGYLFGFAAGGHVSRTGEAAADILIPAADFRNQRIRRDAIRSELKRIMAVQADALARTGEYLLDEDVPVETEGFLLSSVVRKEHRSAREGRTEDLGWVASLSHDQSPVGELCAVALVVGDAYAAGIPLRKPDRIRCSWDLSTRLNLARVDLAWW